MKIRSVVAESFYAVGQTVTNKLVGKSDVRLTVHRNSVVAESFYAVGQTVTNKLVGKSDVRLTVHRNSVWIRKTN